MENEKILSDILSEVFFKRMFVLSFDCTNQVAVNDMHKAYCNRVFRLVERFKEGGYMLERAYTLMPSALSFTFRHGSTSLHYAVCIDIYVFTYLPDEEFEPWLDAEYKRCVKSEVQNGKRE